MRKDNVLWQLNNATEIKTQDELYTHLDTSAHLENVIYSPDELKQEKIGQRTRIVNKRFERVSFSKTHISGIIFRNCTFHQCLFIGASITNCEFTDCRFIYTNTHKISISRTYINPLSFDKCLDKKKHQNLGMRLYRVLLKNARDEGQIEFERDARFHYMRWIRFQDAYLISRSWRNLKAEGQIKVLISRTATWLRRWFWEKLFGSGVRIRHYIITTLLVILLFSILNFCFLEEFGIVRNEKLITSFLDVVYFTTISLTTLGYGDLVPTTSSGRLFAAFQSIVGFCLFAVLASLLFRRVSP